jgi:hypothetical protein
MERTTSTSCSLPPFDTLWPENTYNPRRYPHIEFLSPGTEGVRERGYNLYILFPLLFPLSLAFCFIKLNQSAEKYHALTEFEKGVSTVQCCRLIKNAKYVNIGKLGYRGQKVSHCFTYKTESSNVETAFKMRRAI